MEKLRPTGGAWTREEVWLQAVEYIELMKKNQVSVGSVFFFVE